MPHAKPLSNTVPRSTPLALFTTGTQSANVIQADVEASNGVVHLINAVLLPPSPASSDNIVQLAQSVPDLSTLVTAVVAAGLAATLSGPGPFVRANDAVP